MVMKKLTLVFLVSLMTVFSYGQNKDGIVYWSAEAGYQFDFDLDGKIDLTVPTQTKDVNSTYMLKFITDYKLLKFRR